MRAALRSAARELLWEAAFGLVVAGAGAIARRPPERNVRSPWYLTLRKARWQPPKRAYGLVWMGLYSALAVSAARVATHGEGRARRRALALWGAGLATNVAWPWLFFAKKRPLVALADLALQMALVTAYTRQASRIDRRAGAVMLPYLGWLAYAGTLNAALVEKNAGHLRRFA